VINGLVHFQFIRTANHFIDGSKTQFRHDFPEFLSNEFHEIDHVFGITGEPLTQFWVLCRNPNRTGIKMTNPHHHAAKDNQRGGGKAVFFGT